MKNAALRCALLWAAVIGWMAVIFAFSAQPGAESDAMTAATVMPIAELLASMQEGADAQTVTYLYVIAGTIVRKLAHLAEYALLGLLLRLLLGYCVTRRLWPAVLIGVVYAATDELHQAFVPGRLGTPVDVLLDAVGVLAGACLAALVRKRRGDSVCVPKEEESKAVTKR